MSNSPGGPADAWSEVRAHEHVMRYRRSGIGLTVLLLRPSASPDALWPELADALATRFRVIVPDLPGTCDRVATWLSEFLEGLGMSGVRIVATDDFCVAAIEQVVAEAIARVVVVERSEYPRDHASAIPLLIVKRALPASEALSLITRFLDGDSMG